ncbi:cell division protein FtsB [Evansella vedderi]|uniref:Cell division protein FtsB n=1 Tax=Evansella vedderi TaxID=38282 RepID=A0ABU0A0A8_9BACI|nr:hypothetical protein [Evansella vedderi]MDQ0256554.1 cell division protein FtsB [Evansella vedderi]
MKKVLFAVVYTGLMLLVACNNGDVVSEAELLEDTDDLHTLIETNEFLVQQLAKVREENEQLKNDLNSLQEENDLLIDDILTVKQQINELEDLQEEKMVIRNELDIMAKEIFQAMNVKNHTKLNQLVASNVTVNSVAATLEIGESETDDMTYTFHYINLDSINYIRQADFHYNREQEIFTAKYELTSTGSKDSYFEGEVILTFSRNSNWKLSSIRYNRQ